MLSDDNFQTFIISVILNKTEVLSDCSNFGAANIYKKESLWVLGNLLGGESEQACEIVIHTKNVFERIIELCSQQTDFQVRTQALVCLYNLCENHQNKYLPIVIAKHPETVFIDVLQNYETHDPYTLKIALSFLSLICEKYGDQAI